MARFFNGDENAFKIRRNALKDFSDLLFHELSGSVFADKAPDVLAAHKHGNLVLKNCQQCDIKKENT